MPPIIATALFVVLIGGLFYLDRDRRADTSLALWIPVVWIWIVCSRPISQWRAAFGWAPAFTGVSPDQYLDGSPLDRAVYVVLLAAGILVLCTRAQQVRAILRANGAVLLYYGYCAVSAGWSDYPEVSFRRWVKAVGYLVLVLIVNTEREQIPAIKRLLARVAFLVVPLSVLLIKYYPALGRSYSPWSWEPFFSGVTSNKNELGMACLISGLASVWRLLQFFEPGTNKNKKALVVHAAILVMIGWLLHMANSMTSMACLLMGSALMIVARLRTVAKRPAMIHAAVLLVVGSSLYALFLDGSMVGSLGRDSSLTGRTDMWKMVLQMVPNPFLGAGFDSFWLGPRLEKIWSAYWFHPTQAHNGYLETYINLGWVGVILLAGVIIAGYRNVIAAIRRRSPFAPLQLAYFSAIIIYNNTEAALGGALWIVFLLTIIANPQSLRPILDVSSESITECEPNLYVATD